MRGPAEAPPRIRAALASDQSNGWSEYGDDLRGGGLLADAGDLELPATGEARGLIEAGVRRLLDAGGTPISLGGDHSVVYPVLRAVGPRHPGVTLLQIDAHPDLYEDFEGDRSSHACPFARILEEGLVSRLVQVGIRTMNGHQRGQAERFGVEVIDMRAWAAGKRPDFTRSGVQSGAGPIYVSIDLDGLDPAFAPGVSHCEPGGLTTREVIQMVQKLPNPLIGADIVELNPLRDPYGLTAEVAAKLVKELASRILRS